MALRPDLSIGLPCFSICCRKYQIFRAIERAGRRQCPELTTGSHSPVEAPPISLMPGRDFEERASRLRRCVTRSNDGRRK